MSGARRDDQAPYMMHALGPQARDGAVLSVGLVAYAVSLAIRATEAERPHHTSPLPGAGWASRFFNSCFSHR